ncbi:MAG TPA: alpha/beta hydrolase [Acidimicrobiia bacterium]|nr:alpha/beta hydrolase [Acidimicrobiia bacterium]
MSPPEWFTRALQAPYHDRHVTVDGCRIHYLHWNPPAPDAPGLVFVHGGAAHAHWYSYIAPMFTHEWNVVSIDLSGHGDSGHRQEYAFETWADELIAVGHDAGFPGPSVIVGHSMGGLVTVNAAYRHPDEVKGAIIVDSLLWRPDAESEEAEKGTFKRPRIYDTFEAAMARFRLVPPQPTLHPYIIEHIGRHSLHHTERGWEWKFDPHLFTRAVHTLSTELADLKPRIALLRGEKSDIVPPDVAEYMYELLGRTAPFVSVPESYHHVFVDQPLPFVAAVRALLRDWEHSIPWIPPKR